MAKFFYFPFGQHGDIGTPVPDAAQDNGSVSYYAGFGSEYQLPLAGGGQALPINRVQFNSMMNDITGAINNIQTQGIPSWIGPSPDSPPLYSGNYPYPKNALVYYSDGNVYQSLIANNQDTPGATVNWYNLSVNAGGVPIGSVIAQASPIAPPNYLACNVPNTTGNGISRTTYAALLSAITVTRTGTTTSSSPTVLMANTSGLTVGAAVEGSAIPAGTTVLSFVVNTSVTLSQNATSTVTGPLVFFPWGNGDGSTTFYLPYLSRRNIIGDGGTPSSSAFPGAYVGNTGGEETHMLALNELAPHTHDSPANGHYLTLNPGGTGGGTTPTYTSSGVTGDVTGLSAQVAFNEMQPGAVMLMCIKYQ